MNVTRPARPARGIGARSGAAVAAALALALALLLASPAAADYEQVGNFAEEGSAEQLQHSTGVAVNLDGAGGVEAGSVYVSAANRLLRYGPRGEFREAWGWDTIASGPDLPNEVRALTVNATSGTYALEGRTGSGRAESHSGSTLLTGVKTEIGAFHVGDTIEGGVPLPAGATITAVGPGTLEVSVAASGSNEGLNIDSYETTAPIAYDASAAQLEEALLALPAFEAGDVSVTGGPGDAEGTTPYELTLEGAYAGSQVGLHPIEASLAGGIPSSSASAATIVSPTQPPRYERCRPANGDVCTHEDVGAGVQPQEEGVGRFYDLQGVAVDQATGYVYVLNSALKEDREHNLIEVFSAGGSESIARFGDAGAYRSYPELSESIEEGPEKLHRFVNALTVDEAGKLYVTDTDFGNIASPPGESRVMCFEPQSPGDYEHYEYCGRAADIRGPFFARGLALDDSGHLYGASETQVRELSLAEPATPLCSYEAPGGNLGAMTANPATGEVFYASGFRKTLHRLGPCDPETGEFEEIQEPLAPSPATKDMRGLAVNPGLTWGPEREAGALYAADSENHYKQTPHQHGIGDIFAPAEIRYPSVEAESVSATRTSSAVLGARIDPHGYATRYAFQYLSEAEYAANEAGARFAGAREAPAGGGQIGGAAEAPVSAAVTGLAPDTAYRFRVIATSECEGAEKPPCATPGEAASFATYPLFPPGLPDHRAYEMVSPPEKQGGEVIPAEPRTASCVEECKPGLGGQAFPMQSSPGGDAVVYEGPPFSPAEGSVNLDSYLSRRSEAGWQTTTLNPALQGFGDHQGAVAFDAALTRGLIYQESPALSPAAPAGYRNLYAQPTSEPGSLSPLLTSAPPNRVPANFKLSYAGRSAGLSRAYFAANDALTGKTPFAPAPEDPGVAKDDLYEWREGRLTLLNVLPGNEEVAAGASFGSLSPDNHAISEDGGRVFFEDEAGQLYVRENGELTREVHDPGHFLAAAPDGSKALLGDGCLYDLQAGSCADLTEGKGGFEGLAGKSEDLSHVYFLDTEALAANEGAGLDEEGNPQHAEAGQNNLYSWSAGKARFIATLTAGIKAERGTFFYDKADWAANPSARTAEASPNGRFLAFASVAKLTGYENYGDTCGRTSTQELYSAPCREAFLFDSATGRLLCASCNPSGEAPLGRSSLRRIDGELEWLPQPRYLTDEGRLYFDSGDSLSARDTNEGAEDVYEYEPPGAGAEGSCERAAGCVFLISAGTEPVDSNLLAVDETGANVFFTTRDQLSLKDRDDALDLYDAREGGGIAAESEASQGECQGEACLPAAPAPNDATPASASFKGAGNLSAAAGAGRCGPAARRAKRLASRARRLRRSAKRLARRRKPAARRAMGRAHRLGKRARKLSASAKRCRRSRAAKRNHGGAK